LVELFEVGETRKGGDERWGKRGGIGKGNIQKSKRMKTKGKERNFMKKYEKK